MWKNLLRSILFILIFAALFLMITPVFVPKSNAPGSGIHEPEAKGFLSEDADSIDVLFLGDSEVFSTFIPLRIWQQHGITSYSCSTGDQVMYQSYAYLKQFFQTQSPGIVMLEANALYREFTVADMISYEAEEIFPLLRYHDRWKDLSSEDLLGQVRFDADIRDRGYIYRTRSIPASTEGYMTPSEDIYPMPPLSVFYFRQIRDLCAEQGARLIVVSAPSPTNWDYYYHNGVVQLLQGQDIPYLDMNLMTQQIPVDWSVDSYDGGDHLNYTGACKVTDYIGTYLAETGLFANKLGLPQYESWDQAAAEFEAVAASDLK